MAEDILSQEEVDALLRGVGTETEPPGAAPAQAGVARPYALGREARIVRARMPGLDLVGERFARGLREAMTELLRRETAVSLGPIRVVDYAEFLRGLAAPANLNLIEIKPLRGSALLVFDRGLVLQALDCLFGGQGRAAAREAGAEMTPMELRVDRRLLQVVCDAYSAAWRPLQALEFRHARSESSARFANVAAPGEAVVVTGCSIDLGAGAADFQLCIPYAMLEPIRDVLYGGPPAERRDADGRWQSALSAQVYATEVELTAKLASTELPLWQLLRLQVGDVISLELPDAVLAEVDGVPVLQCRYGVVNGRYALKVERAMGADGTAGQ
jgi:flagellar motor switch protein FliM